MVTQQGLQLLQKKRIFATLTVMLSRDIDCLNKRCHTTVIMVSTLKILKDEIYSETENLVFTTE